MMVSEPSEYDENQETRYLKTKGLKRGVGEGGSNKNCLTL